MEIPSQEDHGTEADHDQDEVMENVEDPHEDDPMGQYYSSDDELMYQFDDERQTVNEEAPIMGARVVKCPQYEERRSELLG